MAVIEPFDPKPQGEGGRQRGTEWVLCIHFLLHWIEMFDPNAEEVLSGSRAVR